MLNIIKAIFFGIVEGVTEWLPVSSTGHMILLNEFITLDVSKEFWNMFLVVIQFGAIMAVILLYWDTIWPIHKSKTGKTRYVLRRATLSLWGKTIVACIPAAVVGLALDDWLDAHFYNWKVVSIMLILVGIAFIVIENRNEKALNRPGTRQAQPIDSLNDLSYRTAFEIGIFQLIAAVFPGTSRSGATIIGGLLVGVSRKTAAEFTFILAIPVMFGASLLKIFKYFHGGNSLSSSEAIILMIGLLVAFLISIAIIRFLMNYIRKHDFKVFGWYRIVLGIVVILYFAIAG
ncbi:MAG: undecaprenyl-diphosphate phosphatase [Eubacteriales bacterium]|nr:undecaprenyl-diphosphate phosphatase [Eubacteriales bacterium]